MVTDPLPQLDDKALAAWFQQLARAQDAYEQARAVATEPSFIESVLHELSSEPSNTPQSSCSERALQAAVRRLEGELESLSAIGQHAAFTDWRKQLKERSSGPHEDLKAWLKATEYPELRWSARQSLHLVESRLNSLSAARYKKSQRLTRFASLLTSLALAAGIGGASLLWLDSARLYTPEDLEDALSEFRAQISAHPKAEGKETETSQSTAIDIRIEKATNNVLEDLTHGRRTRWNQTSRGDDPQALELKLMKLRMGELVAARNFDVARAEALAADFEKNTAPATALLTKRWKDAVQAYDNARKQADLEANKILAESGERSARTTPTQENMQNTDTQWGTFATFVGVTCLIGLALLSWLVVHATLVSRDHLSASVVAEDRAGYARLALARLALSGPVAANETLDLIALVRQKPTDKDDDDA